MADKAKNTIEEAAREFLSNSLSVRFDICTCQICKDEMLSKMLAQLACGFAQAEPDERRAITRAGISAIDEISKKPRHPLIEDKEQAFKFLLGRILDDRGLDFRQYHKAVIKRKVASRIYINNLKSYFEYASFLVRHPAEYDKLLEELCINVTEFFRDAEVWVTVRYLLETVINRKKSRKDETLRIWSAGSSSGEEPYSIAIVLKEMLKSEFNNFSLELYATDIDKKCLNQAKSGIYPKASLKNVEESRLRRYFTPGLNGNYRLNDEILSLVRFQYLDLINDEPVKDTDVIFCRNVFIYFNRSLQEQLLMKFYKSLKPGGYLVKGKSETIFSEAQEIFKDIDSNARIYQKV